MGGGGHLNPGAVAGGSGGQYFVGDFDGTTFRSQTTVPPTAVPAGTSFETFDGRTWNGWRAVGDAGSGPWATVADRYLNLLVGGGRHPYVPGSQPGNEPPPGRLLWDGFEGPAGSTPRRRRLERHRRLRERPGPQPLDAWWRVLPRRAPYQHLRGRPTR